MMIRLKTEMRQNSDHQPASSPKRGIFERFMNKSFDQASGEHSQEMGSVQSSDSRYVNPETGSGTTVKVEDASLKQTGTIQDVNMQDTKIALSESLVEAEPQGTIDGSVSHSLAKQHEPDSQNKQGNIAITSRTSKQEEQMEDISNPIASTNDTVLAEKAGEETNRKNVSEKKRKRKHSRKRSKSRGRSKRSKIAEPISSNDERTGSKSLEGDEEDGFDVAGTRAKLPKDLSVRHEATQKEELKEGSKLFNSKKFKKMMVAKLKDHQVTVASWMVKREREVPRQACGGIIGDEMGLGKTVTSLACIAANKPRKEDKKSVSQATLVVVPNRKIATQWLSEAKVNKQTSKWKTSRLTKGIFLAKSFSETLARGRELTSNYI
jgi:SNF2 family DNA or RNA helicase